MLEMEKYIIQEYNRYKNKRQNKTVEERILGGFVSQYATRPLWRPKKSIGHVKEQKESLQ